MLSENTLIKDKYYENDQNILIIHINIMKIIILNDNL